MVKKRPGPPIKLAQPTEPVAAPVPPMELDDKIMTTFGGRVPEPVEITTESLITIHELGRGAYGVVEKVKHDGTGIEFAIKRIHATINDEEQRRMIIELQANMLSSKCEYLVQCFGAMFREGDVWICMEIMDVSLDKFYRMCVDCNRSVPESAMQMITLCTLRGLDYMKREMKLMHRDVKPSNILADRQGNVKICDFGISGHLTNSVAKTVNAGAKPYMAPERIEGDMKNKYDVRADIWSLGISLIEIASGTHPYSKWKTPFEQLKQVVLEPSPRLPDAAGFSDEFRMFIDKCVMKNAADRPHYPELLADPWIVSAESVKAEDFGKFVDSILNEFQELKNRFES